MNFCQTHRATIVEVAQFAVDNQHETLIIIIERDIERAEFQAGSDRCGIPILGEHDDGDVFVEALNLTDKVLDSESVNLLLGQAQIPVLGVELVLQVGSGR